MSKDINIEYLKIGRLIKNRREALGLSQQDVANHVNVTKSAISRWESGEVKNMGRSKIQKLAEVLKLSPVDIVLGKKTDSIIIHKTKKVPLLGSIAAGEPILACEEHSVYIEVGYDVDVDFCLRVKGDSMIDARILDGDLVFVRQQPIVENGEIAAILIDGEVTLKRFYKNGNGVILKPENSKYQPRYYTEKDFKDIKILGKAILFQSKL